MENQNIMNKFKLRPLVDNSLSNRVTGSDISLDLFSQIVLKGYEQDFRQMDFGVIRINPIKVNDQAIIVCCVCGCF